MSTIEFTQVLYGILSTSKDERKNAENYFYSNLEAYPEDTIKKLIETYEINNQINLLNNNLSLISLVLLRYSLTKINDKLSLNFLNIFFNIIIKLWINEKNLNFSNRLSSIIIEFYNNKNLLYYIYSSSSSSNSSSSSSSTTTNNNNTSEDFHLFNIFIEQILSNFYSNYLILIINSSLNNDILNDIILLLTKFFTFFELFSQYNTNYLIHYNFQYIYKIFYSFLIPLSSNIENNLTSNILSKNNIETFPSPLLKNNNMTLINYNYSSYFYNIINNNNKLKNLIYRTILSCLISLNPSALEDSSSSNTSNSNETSPSSLTPPSLPNIKHNFNDYEEFLSLLLDHLHNLVQNNEEEDSIKIMEHLITLVQEHPLYFKNLFSKLVQLMLFISNLDSDEYDFSIKSMALEVLITITESCPALARKLTGFLDNLSELLLNLYINYNYNDEDNDKKIRKNLKKNGQLIEVENDTYILINNKKYYNIINENLFSLKLYTEDTSNSNSSDSSGSNSSSNSSSSSSAFSTIGLNSDDEEDYINYINESIERITSALGGKHFAPHFLNIIQKYSSLSSWKHRLGSILALLSLTEGDSEYMKQYIGLISQFLLALLEDKSLRVKYYSIETLGRIIFLYDDNINTFFQMFLNSLINIIKNYTVYNFEYNKSVNDMNINNFNCRCIRGHAISALINLFSSLSSTLVLPSPESGATSSSILTHELYHSLVEGLIFTMNNNEEDLKGPCILSLGYLALIGKENFIKYYSNLMKEFFNYLNNNLTSNNIELKSKIIISIGLICEAVGYEVIKNDILYIMEFYFKIIDEEEAKIVASSTDSTTSVSSSNYQSDLLFDYILPSCTKIAKVLKENFIVYYAKLFNIFQRVIMEPLELILEDVNYDDEDILNKDKNSDNKLSSTIVNINNNKKKLYCNTFLYQQKILIIKIMYEFNEALDISLAPYLLTSINLLHQLIQEKISSEIRNQAGLTLEKYYINLIHLFNYNRNLYVANQINLSSHNINLVKGSNYVPSFINENSNRIELLLNNQSGPFTELLYYSKYFNDLLLEYINIIYNEKLPETKVIFYEGLFNIFEELFNTCQENEDGIKLLNTIVINIDDTIYDKLLGIMLMDIAEIMVKKNKLDELKQLKKLKNSKLAIELYDDDDIDEKINDEIEKEDDYLTILINIIGILIKLNCKNKTEKNKFMNKFDSIIAPAFQSFLSLDQPISQQIMGISLIVDMFEYGEEDSKKYLESILPILIYNSNKKVNIKNYDNLKQCSLYGLCINLFHHQDYMTQFLSQNDHYLVLIDMLYMNISFVNNNQKKLTSDFLEDYEGVIENSIYCLACLLLLPAYHDIRNKSLSTDISNVFQEYASNNYTFSNIKINTRSFPSLFLLLLEYLPLKLDNFLCMSSSKMLVDFVYANLQEPYLNNFKNYIWKVISSLIASPLLTNPITLERIHKLTNQ